LFRVKARILAWFAASKHDSASLAAITRRPITPNVVLPAAVRSIGWRDGKNCPIVGSDDWSP
ncbi:hypothetical protein ACP3XM_24535, partial [Salmonella enterica]|uniref:hypothetical protein n=1 Tax=Salmonella enterica TaxID=28901 RepID=UPI003CE731C5